MVGRSHECDTPADITALPALTAPKFDTSLSSRAIDSEVKRLVTDGLAVYRVDQDGLRALKPDIILTQDQCEVCAASLKDVEAAVCDWVGHPVQVVSLRPNSLDDIWRDILQVGQALNCPTTAESLVAQLKTTILRGTRTADSVLRVACIEWIDPLMTAGHWIPELFAMAGAQSIMARAGGPSPYITLPELAAADPDLIVVAPCSFDVARSLDELRTLRNQPAFMNLRAVKAGHVAVADGNKYFNRPSPAVADTVEILRDILGYFAAGTPAFFHATVWQPWAP